MRFKNKYLAVPGIIFLAFTCLSGTAQDARYPLVSLDLSNADFRELVRQVESQCGCRFYYSDRQVEGLSFSYRGNEQELEEVLDTLLDSINYIIASPCRIIITGSRRITTRLPDYTERVLKPETAASQDESMTETELRYIRGRKTADAETRIIGERNTPVKNAILNGRIFHFQRN